MSVAIVKIKQFVNQVKDSLIRRCLDAVFRQLVSDLAANKVAYDRHTHKITYQKGRNFAFAGWAAKATGDPDLKTTANICYEIGGRLKQIASGNVDVSALTGYLPVAQATGTERYYLICGDASSALSCTEGAAMAADAPVPATPANKVALCAIKVVNASAGDFTFGTTNLDTAGLTITYEEMCESVATYLFCSLPGSDAPVGISQGTVEAFAQNLEY
jgi:hypothetical protein